MIKSGYKKLALSFLVISLLAALVIAPSCAQPAAPTAPPAAAPTAPPAAAPTHPIVNLTFYPGQFASGGYYALFALSDILAKSNSWLRATVIETTGAADAIKTIYADPALRKKSLWYSASPLFHDAFYGTGPFTEPIKFTIIAGSLHSSAGWVTLDPNIKTLNDLQGKKVSVGTKGVVASQNTAVFEAHGIKLGTAEYLSQMDGKDALIDGRLDAVWQVFGDVKMRPYTTYPSVQELLPKKGFTIASVDKAAVAKVPDMGFPVGYIEIEKDLMGPGLPPATSGLLAEYTVIGALPEMPDDVSYELARVITENIDKFKETHGLLAGMNKNYITDTLTWKFEFAPGAAKYYREKGMLK